MLILTLSHYRTGTLSEPTYTIDSAPSRTRRPHLRPFATHRDRPPPRIDRHRVRASAWTHRIARGRRPNTACARAPHGRRVTRGVHVRLGAARRAPLRDAREALALRQDERVGRGALLLVLEPDHKGPDPAPRSRARVGGVACAHGARAAAAAAASAAHRDVHLSASGITP